MARTVVTPWPALRLDRHCGDMGPLVVEAAAPCVGLIQAEDSAAHVVVMPGWRGGPHLRIAVDLPERRFRKISEARLRPPIEAWFAANPTSGSLDAGAYKELSRKLARAELASESGLPSLMPDGVMGYGAYQRSAPYDCPALADARDFFFADSFGVAVELIALRLRSRSEWLMRLVELLATLGRIAPTGDYDFWPSSVLAHATSFLVMYPNARDAFTTMTARHGATIATRVATTLARPEDTVPSTGWWRRWLAALQRLDGTIRRIVSENHAELSVYNVYGTRQPAPSQKANVPAELLRTRTHLQYRLIINFVYAALPIMGITPRERAWLCHAVSTVCKQDLPDVWRRAGQRIDELMQEAGEGNLS